MALLLLADGLGGCWLMMACCTGQTQHRVLGSRRPSALPVEACRHCLNTQALGWELAFSDRKCCVKDVVRCGVWQPHGPCQHPQNLLHHGLLNCISTTIWR